MSLDPQLLELLACPEDKGPLYYLEDEDSLVNPRLARRYPIREGIPALLVDEAEDLDASELARIQARIDAEAIAPSFDPATND